jgi:hypothetical protein
MAGATVFFVRRVGHWFQITCAMITVTVSFTVPVAAWFMICKQDLWNRYGQNCHCEYAKDDLPCPHGTLDLLIRNECSQTISLHCFPLSLYVIYAYFQSSLHL